MPRIRLRPCFEVSPEEATMIFDSIKANSQSDEDWARVAADCHVLATAEFVTWDEDEAWEDYGIALHWNEYWQRARGWAEAQLSPSEYRKMRERDEGDAAERRLRNYFFGKDWVALPQNAQRRLINADLIWNSRQDTARETILNDLLRATEAMCYDFIWQPLARNKSAYPEFQRYEDKVAQQQIGHYPGVWDYVSVCESGFFMDFCTSRGLRQADEKFMGESLPIALKRLVPNRNDEHIPVEAVSPDTVKGHYRTFLGIGRRGVLPELARIGRKLRGGRRGGR